MIKKILIAHRGNINGPDPEKENSPEYIMAALQKGYHAEVDVWFVNQKFYLGHDAPVYEVSLEFLKNDRLWCHAKNLDALHEMLKFEKIHCLWHQEDDATITSRGHIWTYPGRKIFEKSVCVMPEKFDYSKDDLASCFGICTDLVRFYGKLNMYN